MALREIFASFGVEFDTRALDAGQRRIEAGQSALKELIHVAGTLFAVHAAERFIHSMIEIGDQIADTSEKIGITTDALQELSYAANVSGTNSETLVQGIGLLSQKLFDASEGSKELSGVFKDLGVQVKNADGSLIGAESALDAIADRFQQTEDPTKRVALAMKVFGRSGKDLIPLLSGGAAGLRVLREEARETGGVLSVHTIEASKRAKDSLERLSLTWRGLQAGIANRVLPAVQKFVDWLIELRKRAEVALKGVDLERLAKIAAAIALMTQATKLFALAIKALPFVGALAGLAALVLLVDSLIVSYQGGRSAVREFVLAHTRWDINELLDGLVDTWKLLGSSIQNTTNALLGFVTGATAALAPLQAMFDIISKIVDKVGIFGGVGKAIGNNPVGALLGGFVSRTASDEAVRRVTSEGAERRVQREVVQRASGATVGAAPVPVATRNNNTTINITGVTDAKAVADMVDKRLKQRDQAAYDAITG